MLEEIIKVKIRKFRNNTKLPVKQKKGDAGVDCYISCFKRIVEYTTFKTEIIMKKKNLISTGKNEYILKPLERIACPLGFATEIPKGYYAQVVPRSGLALWKGITILNTPGTVDSGYRGEWIAIVVNLSNKNVILKVGDCICQLIFRRQINYDFIEETNLSETDRGIGGFGSTDKTFTIK